MMARISMAPTMPQVSTLFCFSVGTLKYSKSTRNTKRLSTDRLCSTKYLWFARGRRGGCHTIATSTD
jgi:hypothetical protein